MCYSWAKRALGGLGGPDQPHLGSPQAPGSARYCQGFAAGVLGSSSAVPLPGRGLLIQNGTTQLVSWSDLGCAGHLSPRGEPCPAGSVIPALGEPPARGIPQRHGESDPSFGLSDRQLHRMRTLLVKGLPLRDDL